MHFAQLRCIPRVKARGWNLSLALLLLSNQALGALACAAEIEQAGRIEPAALSEVSGLAASRREPALYWAHNDSGHPAELYGLDSQGRLRRQVAVTAAASIDWEDLASFELDGQAWLAIADTGDNFQWRGQVAIHVLPEPAPEQTATAPAREIRFRYEDGPRDCEALAADPAGRRFLLVDKGRHPAGLYAIPMDAPAGRTAVAQRLADLPSLWPDPLPPAAPIGASRYRGAVTAMDLSADGRRLLLLTYTHLALFERAADEDWAQAARRPPRLLRLPAQKLFEAVAFDPAGIGALLGREGIGTPLFRWSGRFPR